MLHVEVQFEPLVKWKYESSLHRIYGWRALETSNSLINLQNRNITKYKIESEYLHIYSIKDWYMNEDFVMSHYRWLTWVLNYTLYFRFPKKGTKNTMAWFSQAHILQWDQKEQNFILSKVAYPTLNVLGSISFKTSYLSRDNFYFYLDFYQDINNNNNFLIKERLSAESG